MSQLALALLTLHTAVASRFLTQLVLTSRPTAAGFAERPAWESERTVSYCEGGEKSVSLSCNQAPRSSGTTVVTWEAESELQDVYKVAT